MFLRVGERSSGSQLGRDDFFVFFFRKSCRMCSINKRSAFVLINAHMNDLGFYMHFFLLQFKLICWKVGKIHSPIIKAEMARIKTNSGIKTFPDNPNLSN